MTPQESLIEILLDPQASDEERDDAAMDLASYDAPEVMAALLTVGSNPSTPGTIAASAGESLAEIWLRRNQFDADAFAALFGEARHEAAALILSRRSNWLSAPKSPSFVP